MISAQNAAFSEPQSTVFLIKLFCHAHKNIEAKLSDEIISHHRTHNKHSSPFFVPINPQTERGFIIHNTATWIIGRYLRYVTLHIGT